MNVEKCLNISYTGCGDGMYSAANAEQCDDGNLVSGDGCSSTCQIENLYQCTAVAGQLSVCTPIVCGNGIINPGEQCDDGNLINNDGCTNCIIDLGYICPTPNATCVNACGDGLITSQTRVNATTGASYVAY